MLQRLHKNDIEGPLLPGFQLILELWSPSQSEEEVQPHFIVKACNETVANYSTHDVRAATKWFSRSTLGLNLSQISVNYPSDADASYCDFEDFDDSDGNAADGNEADGDADGDVAEGIAFPTAAEATTTYKETNAFQAVLGPLMKEYLGLLELAERKEAKIKFLVSVMSDLL
jgi:catechol 2,3-dioxygenase-like lactoylglutathione lyase family enzyme